MEASQYPRVRRGDGYAAAQLEDLGEGPGFRKVRRALGVEAFGVNAIVLPPGTETGFHYHERQEELYFLHSGSLEIEFGDGSVERLAPGGLAWVDAPTHRKLRNPGEEDAVYLIVGAKDGYVGRDGRAPDASEQRVGPTLPAG